MPDVLRVVTFSAGGRPIETLNLNSAPGSVTAYFRERGSFQFTPAASSVQYSKTARRYGGSRAVGETHDNGSIAWTAYVRGATLLAATQNVEALIALISDEARGRYVEWAPEGGSSSFFEIAGPGSWTPTYDPVEFVQTNAMRVQLAFPVLPLVCWARSTIADPFDVDSRTDYTFDGSTSADVAVSGSTLTPVVGAALSVARHTRHTARGYDHLEGQATLKTTPGATITSYKFGVKLRASTSSTYVEVYVDDNGTNSRLRIDVVIAGTPTNRSSTNLAARLSTGTFAWVRARIEYGVVFAEYFTAAPTPMATPTLSASYPLVSGDAPLNTTAGKSGWSWIPQAAGATITDFTFAPVVRRNMTLPDTISPADNIPGNAPALADVTVTPSGGVNAAVFALIAWAPRPSSYSLVQNGDFESDATNTAPLGGWSTSTLTNFNTASATTIRAQAAAGGAKFGTKYAEIITPATSGAGVNYRVSGIFHRGVTYTLEMWMRAPASVTSVKGIIGSTVSGDVASTASAALTTTHTLFTVAWTPTADRSDVYIGTIINAATATTYHVDAVRVYSGTAPASQVSGAGAYPPFGILEAEVARDLSGWAVTSSAQGHGGAYVADATTVGPKTYTASLVVDPSLMTADDFTANELTLEVWARVYSDLITPSVNMILSVVSPDGTTFGTQRFTNEYGATGRSFFTGLWRMLRLGTITVSADPLQRRTLKLWIVFSAPTSALFQIVLDYLVVVAAGARALSPTGKPNDAAYPAFVHSSAETSKTVRSDLSGLIAAPPNAGMVDHGLGGSLIQPPPGAVDWLVKLANEPPDVPVNVGNDEQLAYNATVQVDVTPRSFMLRSA